MSYRDMPQVSLVNESLVFQGHCPPISTCHDHVLRHDLFAKPCLLTNCILSISIDVNNER